MLTIGIPVKNSLQAVKRTIDSVQKNTINEYELIIVDDCSDRETKEYLTQFNPITNETTKGFPYNCNQILKTAKYEKICLLNSDVYCPPGWDEKLVKALDEYDIVGPSTCRVYGEQLLLEAEPFQKTWSIEQIEDYARKISAFYGNGTQIIKTVGGFCFCIKKSTIEQTGYFNEDYGLGSYEETEMCLTARNLGLKCAWVKGSYVHHYGHMSFDSVPNCADIWKENRKKFQAKFPLFQFDSLSTDIKLLDPKNPPEVPLVHNKNPKNRPML